MIMDPATSKEEHEAMLNRKMEEMKKKSAELLRRHQLAEEDRRMAEEQGRSVTIKSQQTYTPMKGEILRAAEEERERKTKQQTSNSRPNSKKMDRPKVECSTGRDDGPPPDPTCKFLADRHREGPFADASKGKMFSRRHPRNFGGTDFRDVPKKIHDEKEKLINHPQTRMADFTVYTTGKERRELAEWRKEREQIDRERLERQKNKEGNWKREWDQDKDELSYSNQHNESKSFLDHHQHHQHQPVSRPVGRIGSGRFSLGHHKLAGLHKPFGRKDDKFKASGKAKPHQRYRITQDDAEDENLYEFVETKSKKTLIPPSDQGDAKAMRGNFGGQLRVVCEKNDSLIIKVKNEPADSGRSPQAKTVTFMEPRSTDFIDYNEPWKSQKTFREVSTFRSGGGNNKGSSNSSSKMSARITFKKPAIYTGENYSADTSRSTYRPHGSSSVDKNCTKPDLIVSETSAEKSPKGGQVERTEERSSIENDRPQVFLKSGYGKKEESVGSGRLTAQPAAKRQKNKHQRRKLRMSKSQQNKPKNSGEVVLSVETTGCEKTSVNDESRGKNGNRADCERQPAVDLNAVSNTLPKHQDMSLLRHPTETFQGNDEDFGCEGDKVEKLSSIASSCVVEAASVNCDRLDGSFDLDEDSPNGDQFDDEEWEDIDEEVCIDLIDRGEGHFEDDSVLDISDENFDKFISESVISPRNHVDWAAEMESMERRPSAGQCGDARSVQQESQ